MVTDGDMNAAAQLTASFMAHWTEIARVDRQAAQIETNPDKKLNIENGATRSLDQASRENMLKTFEGILTEVIEIRISLSHRLSKEAYRANFKDDFSPEEIVRSSELID